MPRRMVRRTTRSRAIVKRAAPRRRTTRRRKTSHRSKVVANRSIIWKSPSGQFLPQRYFAKLHVKVAGYFTVAGAVPIGFNSTQANKVSVVLNYGATSPFTNFGATNGLSGATNFSTISPVGYNTLAAQHLYQQSQCLAAKFKMRLLPSATVANDNVWLSLTPTVNQVSNPGTINNAIDQPYSKIQLFKGTTGEYPCKLFVPFAKFLGVKKEVFENDIVGTAWSSAYNAVPTQTINCVINLNMADGVAPSASIPFEMDLTQYWKFYAPVSAIEQ